MVTRSARDTHPAGQEWQLSPWACLVSDQPQRGGPRPNSHCTLSRPIFYNWIHMDTDTNSPIHAGAKSTLSYSPTQRAITHTHTCKHTPWPSWSQRHYQPRARLIPNPWGESGTSFSSSVTASHTKGPSWAKNRAPAVSCHLQSDHTRPSLLRPSPAQDLPYSWPHTCWTRASPPPALKAGRFLAGGPSCTL